MERYLDLSEASLSDIINRGPLTFGEYLRRLNKISQRGMTIEYTLIILLTGFAAFQILFAIGAKASLI
jgi:hypothetical protein